MVFGDLTTKFSQAVIDDIDFLLLIVGNGSAQKILDVIKQYIPIEGFANLGDDVLMAVIGYILWSYGDRIHPRLIPLGLGMFIAGAGSFTAQFVDDVIDQFLGGGGGQ